MDSTSKTKRTSGASTSRIDDDNSTVDAPAATVAPVGKIRRVAHLPILMRKMKSKRVSKDIQKNNNTNINNSKKEQLQSRGTIERSDKETLFKNAIHLNALMEEISDDDDDDYTTNTDDDTDTATAALALDEENCASTGDDDMANEASSLLNNTNKNKKKKKKRKNYDLCCCCCPKLPSSILHDTRQNVIYFLQRDVLCGMVPLLVAAFILYYGLGNPDLEFLPNTATLAWYLIFAVRLHITYTLAQCTRFVVLDVMTIRTSIMAKWSGPFVALFIMQSNGWPSLLTLWGIWNIFLLHGRHSFCKHWLDFTGIAIFTRDQNPDGDGILESHLYGRILFAMVFIGVASALKRTAMALFFSRRMLRYYKEQLEAIMFQMQLITGVAGLAAETEKPGFDELLLDATKDHDQEEDADERADHFATRVQRDRKSTYMEQVPTFDNTAIRNEGDGVSSINSVVNDDNKMTGAEQHSHQEKWQEMKERAMQQQTNRSDDTALHSNMDTTRENSSTVFDSVFATLDRYEPPKSNATKQESPSLHDILQFEKANAFLSSAYPFTTAFGRADTRKNCVRSSIKVYRRLQKFTLDDDNQNYNDDQLSFDVIGALAYREDGSLDENRAQGLLKIFLPDKDNCISLNAFVHSCDQVYKQIQYLVASMSNSSKIDSVLEDTFNVFFYGVLGVMILSLLGWNLWPLIVSFSTLFISLTFAVGPSCAKLIEGILAIAVRRPFDLGDRISLASGLASSTPVSETWIVEDINLTTTTLRLASTNEVSTVNNSALSEARIVNCARSPKAIVRLRVVFRIDASHEKLDSFEAKLKAYLRDRPNVWVGLIQFVNDGVNRSDGYITYMLGIQHVNSWQDLGKIVSHRGELERETDRIALDLRINYESPKDQMNVELVNKTTDVA